MTSSCRLDFGIGFGGELCLLDQAGRCIASWHVDLDQPELVGLVEFGIVQQVGQLFGRVNGDRLVWCLRRQPDAYENHGERNSPCTSCRRGREGGADDRTAGYRCTLLPSRVSGAQSRIRHC